MESKEGSNEYEVRPGVLNYDDIRKMVPALDGHENWSTVLSTSYG